MLEHDDDDRYITQTVFKENKYSVNLHFVESSDDLFAFLLSCKGTMTPYPSVILLNHYAGPQNAVGIIRDLKSNTEYARIPVVVLSGTINDAMLKQCYAAGANSLIRKPSSATEIHDKISAFVRYWFDTVELP